MTRRSLASILELLAPKKRISTGSGIGVGAAIGTAVGVATGNLGLWIAVGLALGAAFETIGRRAK